MKIIKDKRYETYYKGKCHMCGIIIECDDYEVENHYTPCKNTYYTYICPNCYVDIDMKKKKRRI